MTRRLFVFAAYDKDAIVDDTLLHYLRSISGLGDIIFVMDNDASKSEQEKLKSVKNVIYAKTERHGLYDFGSYRMGFEYAKNKKLLKQYDWVYFVNDSVYGPFWDIEPILKDLESRNVDLTGLIDFESPDVPVQVQSWFVGLSKELINQKFIADFFASVSAQIDKQLIVLKYEDGLTRCCIQHGFKMSTFISGEKFNKIHRVYDDAISVIKDGVPFLKKMSILPGIQYLYPYTSEKIVNDIYNNALRNDKLPTVKPTDDKSPNSKVNTEKVPYKKIFRLTLLSLPLVTIYCQNQEKIGVKSYKIALFDKIHIFKVMKRQVL